MVGMTRCPRHRRARELAVPYAAICVVANWAAGRGDSARAISFAALEDAPLHAMPRAPRHRSICARMRPDGGSDSQPASSSSRSILTRLAVLPSAAPAITKVSSTRSPSVAIRAELDEDAVRAEDARDRVKQAGPVGRGERHDVRGAAPRPARCSPA